MRRLFCITLCLLFAAAFLPGCSLKGGEDGTAPASSATPAQSAEATFPAFPSPPAPAPSAGPGKVMKATIVVKDFGAIELELYPDLAPETVKNFVSLARAGFYDGLIFHRVIPGFMVQGGDPLGDGTGGPGYFITGEFAANGFENPISHERGVISMARRQRPYNSAGSQFFIMHQDYTGLDGEYAAFGRVTSGIEVVDLIAAVETDKDDKPLADVVIESITVDGPELAEPEKLPAD
ncbi:MAG: peptidylprolyl isomerase [Eubacteriales bacterium]|nr:peptidylprolyl isomerase [Eubacteriales bacterium]